MAACLAIIWVWRSLAPDFFYDLWVEFWGLTFDVVFILVVFASFEHRRQRALQIQSQHDIIDDYKSWDSEEARFRLAGAIRRLNKMGVDAINLSGARISDFSFSRNNIASLAGSTFFDGIWGEAIGERSVVLKKVDFSHVNCRSVTFSPYDPFSKLDAEVQRHAKLENCSFIETDLRGATFNGASLKWTEVPPDSHHEFEVDSETGQGFASQVSCGPFDGADLRGASFSGCVFENADFRGASDVLGADFSGARGIEAAEFDDDETRSAVLVNASKDQGKSAA
tara:strand:+ start:4388 stop:5233 length:846 start_codon:yes stop_codon:yes gene_type:complete